MRKIALLAAGFGVVCLFALSFLFRPQPEMKLAPPGQLEKPGPSSLENSGDVKAEERSGASVPSPNPVKEANVGTASQEQAEPESPTGDPELDRVYASDKDWAKRWDKYKKDFMAAQSMRRQPPAPPEHPDVDKDRFRISEPPPGFEP